MILRGDNLHGRFKDLLKTNTRVDIATACTRARLRFTGRAEVYYEGRSPAKPFAANGETLLSRLSHYRGPPHLCSTGQ